MVVPRGHPQTVVWNDVDFPHRCHGTSARAGVDLLCGLGLKMAETRRRTSCATNG